MGHPPMMLKLLLISALLAAATALPSPDAAVPEGALTQSQMHMSSAAKAAKDTVSKMLETGSSDSACAELATTTMNEVTDAVNAQQQALDAFKAPNDGTSCLQEGQDEVTAAQTALTNAQTAASDAAEASSAATGADVDFGPISFSALTESESGVCAGQFLEDPAYTAAKASAASAA